jgi:di/tricarboxylate transporter
MNVADLSVIVLVLLFLGTALPHFHLGLAAFPAAFLVAMAAGLDVPTVIGFFPADFFILVAGVTSLFAIAQANGTMDWILSRSLRLLGGRIAIIPWLIFGLGGLLTAVGTLPTAAVAIMAPIAMGFSARYGITPFLTALVTVLGVIAGMFSPIAVFGLTAANLYNKAGVVTPGSLPLTLMMSSLVTGLLMCTAFVLADRTARSRRPAAPSSVAALEADDGDGGSRGGRSGASPVMDGPDSGPPGGTAVSIKQDAPARTPQKTLPIALTVSALVLLVVCAVGFDLNVGFVALTLTALLQLGLRLDPADLISRIPWGVVLLIGGILTYIGLMQKLGAFERLAQILSVEGAPMLSLLIICYIAAVTSFFASSIAVFATAVPLLPPLIAAGVHPVGALIALAMSTILVDMNPIGPTGGYLLAATKPDVRTRLFRQLLVYGIASVVVVPPLSLLLYSWI